MVRYGPNSLSFNSASALHAIYGHRANVRKADFYFAFPATKDAWSTHSAIDKGLHARKRRVLALGFGDAALRGLQPHILGVVDTFVNAVGDRGAGEKAKLRCDDDGCDCEGKSEDWSVPKDMGLWANYMSYDVLGELCFGQSFDTLTSPTNRFALKLVATSSRFHYLNAQMPHLKQLGLDRVLYPGLRAVRTRFMGYSRARLAERMQLGTETDRRDFFYYLLGAKDPVTGGPGFSTQELWGESNVLLIAGSDTTSTALSATLHFLCNSPSHLEALTVAVRSQFERVQEIVSGPALNECQLLRACVDEAMRLAPPVPGLLPRTVLEGGLTVDGHRLPAGTVVGIPIWALHHNPSYYRSPTEFRPERWLGNSKEGELARSAFTPFSIGPRACIGKGVAMVEVTVALARLLWAYDLRLATGKEGIGRAEDGGYTMKDIFVAEKEGPWVQFRLREERKTADG